MEKLYRILKPLANVYIIALTWSLTILNFYLYFKPLNEYTTATGLKTRPIVLDGMTYYTPKEGYQALTVLGSNGRHAYRLANYSDFVLPVLLFLALSLPNLAWGKGSQYIISPLIYTISDYIENIAEKYVLEIYPRRNDLVMTVACYVGLMKLIFFGASLLIVVINGFRWIFKRKNQLESMDRKQKVQ